MVALYALTTNYFASSRSFFFHFGLPTFLGIFLYILVTYNSSFFNYTNVYTSIYLYQPTSWGSFYYDLSSIVYNFPPFSSLDVLLFDGKLCFFELFPFFRVPIHLYSFSRPPPLDFLCQPIHLCLLALCCSCCLLWTPLPPFKV